MTKTTLNFADMARDIMFAGRLDLARYGVEYRKGKTAEDVKAALRKARDPKNGMAKVEAELSMLEIYLKQVFKAATPAPAVAAQQGAA